MRTTLARRSRLGQLAFESFEQLEQRALLAADLVADFGDFTPPSFAVPGDVITLPVDIRNNDSTTFTGRVQIQIFASDDDLLDEFDVQLADVVRPSVVLAPDASVVVLQAVTITDDIGSGGYRIFVVLTPLNAAGNPVDDEFEDDNTAMLGENIEVRWVFGNFGDRTNIRFVGSDEDGTRFSIALTGGGFGEIFVVDEGDAGNTTVSIEETTSRSALAFAVLGRDNPDADLFIDLDFVDVVVPRTFNGSSFVGGSIGSINAPALNFLSGTLTIEGFVTSITLRDVTDSDIEIGFGEGLRGRGAPMTLTFNDVTDTNLEARSPAARLSVNSWVSSEVATNTIVLPWIGILETRGVPSMLNPDNGRFDADVFVGQVARAAVLDAVTIRGVFGGAITAVGSVRAFTAATFDGSLVASGTIRAATLTSILGGFVWGAQVGSVVGSATNADAGYFEVLAGVRFTFADLVNADFDIHDVDFQWRSGFINEIKITVGNGATDFVGRFAAGIDGSFFDGSSDGPNRDIDGVLLLSAITSRVSPGTASRIAKIELRGANALLDDVRAASAILPASVIFGAATVIIPAGPIIGLPSVIRLA